MVQSIELNDDLLAMFEGEGAQEKVNFRENFRILIIKTGWLATSEIMTENSENNVNVERDGKGSVGRRSSCAH